MTTSIRNLQFMSIKMLPWCFPSLGLWSSLVFSHIFFYCLSVSDIRLLLWYLVQAREKGNKSVKVETSVKTKSEVGRSLSRRCVLKPERQRLCCRHLKANQFVGESHCAGCDFYIKGFSFYCYTTTVVMSSFKIRHQCQVTYKHSLLSILQTPTEVKVTTTTKTLVVEKKARKVYDLPGQKHDPPEEV